MTRKPTFNDKTARQAFGRDWAKRLATFEELAAKKPGDLSQEDVHQLRVTTRRLRASLWVLRHCVDKKSAQRSHRELRAIGKVLGERRMWDIALRDAEAYGARTGAIEKRRKRADAQMRRALSSPRTRAVAKELRKLERTIPGMMLERLAPWLQGYEWELAYRLLHRPKTPAKRHELRIQAKKIRYVLECLGRRSTALENLQEHLGREHDLGVLRGIIGVKRGMARDESKSRASANRVMPRALRSAMRQLHALQKEIKR